MAPSVNATDQAPESSSSTTVSPSFSSFQFRTIGKEPDLLKRISAPEPNQDYQDDSTPCPSPSHSPALQRDKLTGSKPSLFQKLTNGNSSETNTVSHTIGNAPSDLDPGTSTAKPSSAFDPVYAALFSANAQPLSILAVGRRPRSPSDMDMSSAGTTPRIARSLSLTQPAPTDDAVGLTTDTTRFTSADLLNGLELAYPATESRLSALQEQSDSHRRLPMEADTSPGQGFSTRLNNVIAYLESKSLQQSKVLAAIASLERVFQVMASQTSLAVEKANIAEAAAEKSLIIAKDAVAVAQHSVAGVENALAALLRLRQCYADEHAANEHDRADLLCNMTSLKRDIESSPNQGPSCNTGTEPPGLGSDVLRILSTEAMKLVRERDPSVKKRKRSSDKMDPSSTCDLTSRPLKEVCYEYPIPFFDRTVESEAEAAREAWIQEVERRSAVPPDPAQRTAHEQKGKELTARGRKDLAVEEDNAPSGLTQSQLVDEDVDMSSDKPDALLVDRSEESGARGNNHSEESLESKELRARWEREVVEHKLEIARFQMQERDLKEKERKRKEVDGMGTTPSEQTEQSAPLRTRPPPTFVPATTTAANTLERNTQQISQPKPGLGDASRMDKIKHRLALEKQKALPAIGQGPSLAPGATQQNVLQEAPESVADTGRPDFQGQTGNDGVTGIQQEQGEKGREVDDKVTGAKPRGRGTPITRSSVDAKDASKLVFGNVTAQKTLVASTQSISPQRSKIPVPQYSPSMTTANIPVPPHLLLNPHSPWFTMASHFPSSQIAMSMNCGPLPLNGSLSQPLQPREQDTRRASLPPIEFIAEPDQAESDSAIKRSPSSRTPQKRKQGAKKPGKPRQNAGNIRGMNAQPSSTESDSYKKDPASNASTVPPLTLASSDGFLKHEVISPTLIDQRILAQEAQNSPSGFSVQPITAPPQQSEHIVSPSPMSVPQPSRDKHQASSGSGPRSKLPSETAERGLRVEPTNALQPLPVNGQVVAVAERDSKSPSKTTLANPGQTGNVSAFLKTPHGGHREISGSAASSKPLSKSGLVDQSDKAPPPTKGQQVALDPRGEVSASLNSKHDTAVDLSLGAPAVNMPTTRSPMSEKPPADVGTPLNSSQMPSSNDPSTGVSIQHSNSPRLALRVETSQLAGYPNPACSEASSSSPSPITGRKRHWNVMEGDHWSPGQEVRGRRPRKTRMAPPPLLRSRSRSRSPIMHVPLSQRLSERRNPHVGRRSSSSYWPKGDTYRPDESPPYYSGEDDIDGARNQSKSLLDRFTPNTQDPSHRQDHSEFVPQKRPKFAPPRSRSREGRGGALSLKERIS